MDMNWPDEHFQTLEPASSVVFGYGILPWEYTQNYRSWFVPGLYMPLLYALKGLGLTGGGWVIRVCRLMTATVSSTLFFSLNNSLKFFEVSSLARQIALLFFALSPAMILWAPVTSSDHWAMIFVWAAINQLQKFYQRNLFSWKEGFKIGILFGISFLVRLQTVLWFAGVFLVLIYWFWGNFDKKKQEAFLGILFGYGTCFFFLGFLDRITLGQFFCTFYQQVLNGITISRNFGIEPWYFYFGKILENQGNLLFLFIFVLFMIRFIHSRCLKLSLPLGLVFFPGLLFFLGHVLIEHKEIRFLLPLFPLFYILLGILLEGVIWKNLQKKWICFFYPCLLILALLSGFKTQNTPQAFSIVDISELEEVMFSQKLLSTEQPGSCIILFNHDAYWTHGELMLGQKAHFVRRTFSDCEECTHPDRYHCVYGVFDSKQGDPFVVFPQNRWEKIKTSQNGWTLLKAK